MTDNQVYSILAAILFIIILAPFVYLSGVFDRGPKEGQVYEHVVRQDRFMVEATGNCEKLHSMYDRMNSTTLDEFGHLGLDVLSEITTFPYGEDSPDKECVAVEQRQRLKGHYFRVMYMLDVEELGEEWRHVN